MRATCHKAHQSRRVGAYREDCSIFGRTTCSSRGATPATLSGKIQVRFGKSLPCHLHRPLSAATAMTAACSLTSYRSVSSLVYTAQQNSISERSIDWMITFRLALDHFGGLPLAWKNPITSCLDVVHVACLLYSS